MLDVTATQPVGVHGLAARPVPVEPKPAVAAPEASQASGSSTNGAFSDEKRHDPNIQTGPSPAFEASLLELEADLQVKLKRFEAAREVTRNETAVEPAASAKPEAKTEAEPVKLAVAAPEPTPQTDIQSAPYDTAAPETSFAA